MKTKLISLSIIILLSFASYQAKAQYCFWVANQSNKTFYAVKLRVNGTGNAFKDVLPYEYLKSGEHCWVKTTSAIRIWDVQITKLDGTVILFTYRDKGGDWHIDQRFITVNALELHTLVIGQNSNGNLNFSYYTSDQLDYGHPCNN
jgi:hypothetical protein